MNWTRPNVVPTSFSASNSLSVLSLAPLTICLQRCQLANEHANLPTIINAWV
ncbi:MAG TPA: hypothetical protein VFU49_08100 [Ktedonobacteraceae bacterium]|nr:hypothetical protein [Ktedonobacteraceae bacterium]